MHRLRNIALIGGLAAIVATPVFGQAVPLSVVDGDTIRIDGQLFRLANIDAPELRDYQCPAELELAKAAQARLIELLSGGKASLIVGDPADGRTEDRYGRILGTLEIDGVDVGEILIADGLARPWRGKRENWCS